MNGLMKAFPITLFCIRIYVKYLTNKLFLLALSRLPHDRTTAHIDTNKTNISKTKQNMEPRVEEHEPKRRKEEHRL